MSANPISWVNEFLQKHRMVADSIALYYSEYVNDEVGIFWSEAVGHTSYVHETV